jgi:hypothetical protein
MTHLTNAQKESLKKAVLTATVQRLTLAETQQYVKEKLGLDMSVDYLWKVKSNLKKASQNQLMIYQKDKFAYIEQAFFARVAELENSQDILRDIITKNGDKPEVQIKAVAELNNITVLLRKLFEMLPSTTRIGVEAFPLTLKASTPLEALQMSESSSLALPTSSSPPPSRASRRYPGIDIIDMELSEEELSEVNDSSLEKRHELMTNKFIREVMPYYMSEVCRLHQITEKEYKTRVIAGDMSIYLPQPNPKFAPTDWFDRVALALGLDYQGMKDKIDRGEIEHKIATGRVDPETGKAWYDEDPNAVF